MNEISYPALLSTSRADEIQLYIKWMEANTKILGLEGEVTTSEASSCKVGCCELEGWCQQVNRQWDRVVGGECYVKDLMKS